jgi:23S rRNA pseudouridine2457 synthase
MPDSMVMSHSRLLLLNKPFRFLTQFTSEDGKACLKDMVDAPDMYPAGRLDYDSEGLVLLTNWGALQAKLAEPRFKVPKTYFVQVEGIPDPTAIERLRNGVQLNDGMTRPAEIALIDDPEWLWPREPPIRFRRDIPTRWLSLTIREGRNRQVRRMTAAVGHPTLRLIRWSIGPWSLEGLQPGSSREADPHELQEFLRQGQRRTQTVTLAKARTE